MIEKTVGISDRFPNLSAPTTATEIQDGDKNSTNFKVKNFTLETIENKELGVEDKKRKVHYQNSLLGIIVCCFEQ